MKEEDDGQPLLGEREVRSLLTACKSRVGLVHHQIDSYNHFIETTLPAIVKENSILVVNHPEENPGPPLRTEFSFNDVWVQSPSNQEASGFIKPMTPATARLRGLSYLSSVFVDIEQRTLRMEDPPVLLERKRYNHRLLCRLPVMVGSSVCYLQQHGNLEGECPYDEGGYFIVNGMEKVIISQEKLRTNFPYVFPPRKNLPPLAPHLGKSVLTCEVRSSHETKLRSTSTLQLHLIDSKTGQAPQVIAVLPYLECPVPLSWLMHLLGWDPIINKGEMERLVLGELYQKNVSRDSARGAMCALVGAIAARAESEASGVTRKQVLDSIGKAGTHEDDEERRSRYLRYICCSETLPHMGVDDSAETQHAKRVYLCHMLSKLVAVLLGLTSHDDRDHYANKRVDTAGPLIAHLFRQLYRSFLKSLQSQLHKLVTAGKFVDLLDTRLINHKRITGGFKMAFGTGNWGTPKIAGGAGSAVGSQVGITQQLSQMTGISATAHMRRLNTPLHKEGRNPRPRQLSNSAWGVVCPTETPEGIACGLVKNLAWAARVRGGTPTSALLPVVMASERIIALRDCTEATIADVMVTVNGVVVGYCSSHKDAEAVREQLRVKRRSQELPFDTTIAYVRDPWQSVLRIHADTGALLRPVLDISRLKETTSILARYDGADYAHRELWHTLLLEGCIEYIDKDEETTLRVAENMKQALSCENKDIARQQGQPFTHCELHPSIILGVCASLIPFSNHNQSPRNTYQSAMGKQALGIPSANYQQRLDSVMHVLVSPEKPLVATWMDDMTNSRALPAGQNVMVAILCHSGFNQEDSLIMCQSSVDAGMFHSLAYHTHKEESRPNGTDVEHIGVPDPEICTRLKAASYDHLDPVTGMARIGARLKVGDIVIGKTVMTTDCTKMGKVKVVRDKSLQVGTSHEGEVDRVVAACNQEGHCNSKVRTHQLRVPQVGDKFSSRHGQKGVVGMMRHRRDMPFTPDGLTPDIIVNPHAIPSRMTIGHLIETLLGMEAGQAGRFGDGTPFRDLSVQEIGRRLEERGIARYCDTELHCGLTGKKLEARVFFGPTYYQRLKHMVHDKMHARGRGPVTPLTRQPVEGRSREGGLRIGEMERDAFVSHGASANVRESLFERSDPYMAWICRKCGLLCDHPGEFAPSGENGWCHGCATSQHSTEVPMPFACKLTLQEITALMISPRLAFEDGPVANGDGLVGVDQGVNVSR